MHFAEAKKIINAQLKDSANILGTRKSELEAQLNSAQDVLMIITIAIDVQQAIEQAKTPAYIAPAPAKPKEENQAQHSDESLQELLQNAFQKDIRVSVFTYNDRTKVNLSTSNQTKASILTNFLPQIVGMKYVITQNDGINFMIINPELLLNYVLDNENLIKKVFSDATPGDTSLTCPGPYTYPSP